MTNNPEPQGVVTLRILAAAAARSSFTTSELAEAAGASPKTVATVLRRYSHLLSERGTREGPRQGRRAVEWEVTPSERDALLAVVRAVSDDLSTADRSIGQVDAQQRRDAVTLGLGLLVRALSDPDGSQEQVPVALRSALRAAGFDLHTIVHTNPASLDDVGRVAGLLSAIAEVIDAAVSGTTGDLEVAKTLALYWLLNTKAELPQNAFLVLNSAIQITIDQWYEGRSNRASQQAGPVPGLTPPRTANSTLEHEPIIQTPTHTVTDNFVTRYAQADAAFTALRAA